MMCHCIGAGMMNTEQTVKWMSMNVSVMWRHTCGFVTLGPRIRFRFVWNRGEWIKSKLNVHCVLTRWSTVLTTSRLDTWPTSMSPMSTANFRLSVIDILTTSSGRFMSLYGGRVRSAIFHWFSSFIHTIYAQFNSNQPKLGANHQYYSEYHWNADARTCTDTRTQCIYFHVVFVVVVTQWFCLYDVFSSSILFIHSTESPLWRFW